MPIPHLILVNAMLGALSAWTGRAIIRLSSRSALTTPHFAALLIGELALMVPVGLYLYLFYPDWSWLYVFPAEDVPSAIAVLVLAAYPLAAVAGFVAIVAACRASRDRLAIASVSSGLGILVLGVLLAWRRISSVGTFAQYEGGFGLRKLHLTGLGAFLIVAAVGLCVGWIYILVRLRRDVREV